MRRNRRGNAVAGRDGHRADRRLHRGEEDAAADVPRHRQRRHQHRVPRGELRLDRLPRGDEALSGEDADGSLRARRLGPAEVVLDADDVVLLEVGAGLHLDDLHRDVAGVRQPVHGADRQVDRLVLVTVRALSCRRSPRRRRGPRPNARSGGGAAAATASCPASPPSASPGTGTRGRWSGTSPRASRPARAYAPPRRPPASSSSTRPLTSWARSIGATRSASGVSTTARPLTPSTQTRRPSERR